MINLSNNHFITFFYLSCTLIILPIKLTFRSLNHLRIWFIFLLLPSVKCFCFLIIQRPTMLLQPISFLIRLTSCLHSVSTNIRKLVLRFFHMIELSIKKMIQMGLCNKDGELHCYQSQQLMKRYQMVSHLLFGYIFVLFLR